MIFSRNWIILEKMNWTTKIKSVARKSVYTHPSESSAVKLMPEQFKRVVQEIVKMVNFKKSGALNSCLCSKLHFEMGSGHFELLLHTKVRWPSRKKKKNAKQIIRATFWGAVVPDRDRFWTAWLAYLSNTFSPLNDFLSMQCETNRFQ